ncbi:MAG: tRNA(Ser) Um(44) 2'-O-methyltransferase [Candelina mexicana]|nr:MAG: tRNA(Ser) Um(44) 2'-O-methyltransferase [Candelina mexicana]
MFTEKVKAPFAPKDITRRDPGLIGLPPEIWISILEHGCTFSSSIFSEVILNLIKNPNINSTHLVRADILYDSQNTPELARAHAINGPAKEQISPHEIYLPNYNLHRTIIRKLIPRNPQLDAPLLQTCQILHSTPSPDTERNLIVYNPHTTCPTNLPWYHPVVSSLAFLHTTSSSSSTVSIHYALFPTHPELTPRLQRTAHQLLSTLHKHGTGCAAGYSKRVHHDVIIPQRRFQDTYARLKARHAKRLIDNWIECTDPAKHVFEDLGIASFLIELWRDMYYITNRNDEQEGEDEAKSHTKTKFQGFVDTGCGNGVLVDILIREGYPGWGFDARRRKSWDTFSGSVQSKLQELVLVPYALSPSDDEGSALSREHKESGSGVSWHNGHFPTGTFIISNHADELTPWTPLLASLTNCAFIIIPCCSHDFSGAKFRAPGGSTLHNNDIKNETDIKYAEKPKGKQASAYASLVDWIERLAHDCGYVVEKEMLRIPSTRNTALIGRKKLGEGIDVREVLRREGGGEGWIERAMQLTTGKARGH